MDGLSVSLIDEVLNIGKLRYYKLFTSGANHLLDSMSVLSRLQN